MDIKPPAEICAALNINPNEYQTILKLDRFQRLLEDAAATWGSALNTAERIKVKALSALEDWLVELHASLHDKKEPLSSRVEGGKLLKSLAGLDKNNLDVMGGGERFSLTINIGDGAPKTITVSPPTMDLVAEPQPEPPARIPRRVSDLAAGIEL